MLKRLGRLAAICTAAGLLASCADMANGIFTSSHTSRLNSTLQSGQAVLVTRDVPYNYLKNLAGVLSDAGAYRPSVTYWKNLSTGKVLVIGGEDETGYYKLTTQSAVNPQFDYRIVEPGRYALLGFALKTTKIKNLYALPLSDKKVSSPWGLIRFSATDLPELHAVTGYVPPQSQGTTMEAGVITNWYTPGHYEQFSQQGKGDAVYVDARGLLPMVGNNIATLGLFEIKPGQMLVLNDFTFEYEIGACNAPVKGQWDCAPKSLTLSVDFQHTAPDVQKAMHEAGYDEEIISKVTENVMTPGLFFAGQDLGTPDTHHTHVFLGNQATYRVFVARTPAEVSAALAAQDKRGAAHARTAHGNK